MIQMETQDPQVGASYTGGYQPSIQLASEGGNNWHNSRDGR